MLEEEEREERKNADTTVATEKGVRGRPPVIGKEGGAATTEGEEKAAESGETSVIIEIPSSPVREGSSCHT